MLHEIRFSQTHLYNLLKNGITVPTKLLSGELYVNIDAKIDTGASFCVFERKHGERLGLDIESGSSSERKRLACRPFGAKHEWTHNFNYPELEFTDIQLWLIET